MSTVLVQREKKEKEQTGRKQEGGRTEEKREQKAKTKQQRGRRKRSVAKLIHFTPKKCFMNHSKLMLKYLSVKVKSTKCFHKM